MAGTAVEKELVDLEKRYWNAMKTKDVDAAVAMTDEPCIISGAQGVGRISRDEFRKLMVNATWTLHDFEMENMQARMVSDDVAIIAYKVKEKLTVEGKPLTLEASDSSTWVRREGGWKCALHTEAVAGDPFGRDRKPMPKKAKRAD
jgi:ketosteroid isomerase-like protein